MSLENSQNLKAKIEIPNSELVKKVLTGLTELLYGPSYKGHSLVEILDLRLNRKLTLQVIGDMFGTTPQVIRQKQWEALYVLKKTGKITPEEHNKLTMFLRNWNLGKK